MTPRAATDEIDGVDGTGVLRLHVRAVPEDGRANDAVCRLIAKALDVGATRVEVERGQRSRIKQVEVVGVSASTLERRWPGLRMR